MATQIVDSLTHNAGITLAALSIVLSLTVGTVIAVTAIVSSQWRRVRVMEEISALKQVMLEQGMSAEDIATVIKASPKSRVMEFGFNKPSCSYSFGTDQAEVHAAVHG